VTAERLSDHEIVYRRIRVDFLKPQNRIPPSSFKLRPGKDDGISVNLARLSNSAQTIAKGDAQHQYFLAGTTVGEIRVLSADDGTPLQLDVVAIGDEEDASHAEIRGPKAGELPEGSQRALARLFQIGFPIPIGEM